MIPMHVDNVNLSSSVSEISADEVTRTVPMSTPSMHLCWRVNAVTTIRRQNANIILSCLYDMQGTHAASLFASSTIAARMFPLIMTDTDNGGSISFLEQQFAEELDSPPPQKPQRGKAFADEDDMVLKKILLAYYLDGELGL